MKSKILHDFSELKDALRKRPRVTRIKSVSNYNDDRFNAIRKQIREVDQELTVPAVCLFGVYKRVDPYKAHKLGLKTHEVKKELCKGFLEL